MFKRKYKHFEFLSNYAFFAYLDFYHLLYLFNYLLFLVFLQILEFLKMSISQKKAQCAPLVTSFPNVTPLDFFLLGYVNIVYRVQVRDINDLKYRVAKAILTINNDMFVGESAAFHS